MRTDRHQPGLARRNGRRSRCGQQGRRSQRGQALIEALVAGLVLVPLMLLVILLGKVQSMQQATIGAARALAFECTVRPDDCADPAARAVLAEDVRRRHFGRIDREIFSNDVLAADAPAAERHPLWTDRRARALLERPTDVTISVHRSAFDAGRNTAVGRAAGDAAAVLDQLAGPGRFGLSLGDGLFVTDVAVDVSPGQAGNEALSRLDSLPLRLQERTAILTDAWNASGPYGSDEHTVQSRVQRGQRVDVVHETAFRAGYQLTLWALRLMDLAGLEPKASSFRPHETDVDRVPGDRIPADRVAP